MPIFKKIVAIAALLFCTTTLFPIASHAASLDATSTYDEMQPASAPPDDSYYRGRVTKILQDEDQTVGGTASPYQKLEVLLQDGSAAGTSATVENGGVYTILKEQKVQLGEQVVVVKTSSFDEQNYYVSERYRIPTLVFLFLIFFAAVVLFGGWRGLTSMLGLVATVAILLLFVLPRILAGNDPFVVAIVGASAIAIISMYLAHGFSGRTSIALMSTLFSLGLSLVVATLFVAKSGLLGTAAEEAFYVQLPNGAALNFRGMLLAGIIIGVLGVLDDVTTAQTAAIDELYTANPALTFQKLYRHGVAIGREHIASLVNTLVLAYAGTALPLLLVLSMQHSKPLWTVVNGEILSEEIVRTLVGSLTLVFAVPISTAAAAWLIPIWRKWKEKKEMEKGNARV